MNAKPGLSRLRVDSFHVINLPEAAFLYEVDPLARELRLRTDFPKSARQKRKRDSLTSVWLS
jgi:hypothetical protein